MTKQIELSLDGATATATLHEREAPKTAQRLWDALPVDAKFWHGRWSGSAGYALIPALQDPAAPLENRMSILAPGMVVVRSDHGEVMICYGPAQVRELAGNAWAAHVATLDGDASVFLAAVARVQHAGAKQLVVRRKGA